MSIPLIMLVILIEGFVSISVEVLTIRQLSPVIGTDLIVTSSIIGTFLLALAFGYKKGGTYTDNYLAILSRNFKIVSLFLGTGLSYFFILVFFDGLLNTFGAQFKYFSLAIYLCGVSFPLVYLLGQTLPITMNLVHENNAAKIGSRVLYLSTLGSFAGAMLTSIFLMNYLGVGLSIVVNTALLLLSICVINKKQLSSIKFILQPVGILSLAIWFNVSETNKLLTQTTAHNNYKFVEIGDSKIMYINGAANSMIKGKDKIAFPYIELTKKILFRDLNLRHKKILSLGAGGFSLSAASTYNNEITYVDIDPKIKKIAETTFKSKINGKFVADDARHFLNNTNEKYSAIVSDVYNSKTNIPPHLVCREYFKSVSNRLNQEGVAIFNIIMKPMLNDKFSATIDNTIRSVFPSCMVFPHRYTKEDANVLYVCNNSNLANNNIYSDNINTAMLDR